MRLSARCSTCAGSDSHLGHSAACGHVWLHDILIWADNAASPDGQSARPERSPRSEVPLGSLAMFKCDLRIYSGSAQSVRPRQCYPVWAS